MAFKEWWLNRSKGVLNDGQIELLCVSGKHNNHYNMICPFLKEKIRVVDRGKYPESDLQFADALNLGDRIISRGLSHAGYDIALGWNMSILVGKVGSIVDPKDETTYELKQIAPKYGKFVIPPLGYALGASLECFYMPDDIVGLCLGKSTYARVGIDVNLTPLEPGWRGHLTLEISNSLGYPVYLYPGEGIAQVIFFRGRKSRNPYEGKYQDQGPLPRPARV